MPQIFEFHFNPPKQSKVIAGKADLIFDSFCFEPKNVYERRVGSLYMAGLLKNSLPQNASFLKNLAEKIKNAYYKNASSSAEEALRNALRTANEYLETIAKQGDVSWLGNLSFAVISLKDYNLNFTKVGKIKLFLIREGQIVDIDRNLRFDEIEPYPLKIFGNIVSGRLSEEDILLGLNEEVYRSFLNQGIFDEISQQTLKALSLDQIRNFKNILNSKKADLIKISGICLLIILSRDIKDTQKETLSEKSLKPFSYKEVFAPFIKLAKKIKLPSFNLPNFKISFPRIKPPFKTKEIKALPTSSTKNFLERSRKKIIPVLILALLLLLGFFIFQKKEEKILENYQSRLSALQEIIIQADNMIESGQTDRQDDANRLYQEAWQSILILSDKPTSLPNSVDKQLSLMKNDLWQKLAGLNNLNEISEPQIMINLSGHDFKPEKMIVLGKNIYFFSPLENKILLIDEENNKEIIEVEEKIKLAAPFNNYLLLYSENSQIIPLIGNKTENPINLNQPYEHFSFIDFYSYFSHLYFLEKENNSIVRYSFLSQLNWKDAQPWLAPQTELGEKAKSMAIDGSIWILTENNIIEKYYMGELEERLEIKIFPEIKNISKIFTSNTHNHLYLLEPDQKRIIIVNKSGELIEQYQGKKFNNLIDFSVSQDAKTIRLLNGLQVYSLDL